MGNATLYGIVYRANQYYKDHHMISDELHHLEHYRYGMVFFLAYCLVLHLILLNELFVFLCFYFAMFPFVFLQTQNQIQRLPIFCISLSHACYGDKVYSILNGKVCISLNSRLNRFSSDMNRNLKGVLFYYIHSIQDVFINHYSLGEK